MNPPAAIEQHGGLVRIRVRVQPKASRNALVLESDGRLRATLSAPPVDGAANKALCELIAKTLGVPKSSVKVAKGQKSRDKTVEVGGVTLEQVEGILAPKG